MLPQQELAIYPRFAQRRPVSLRNGLQDLASDTDIRHLPDYPLIHEGRLVSSLDNIQDTKRLLAPGERLTIETDDKVYEVDLTKTWSSATRAFQHQTIHHPQGRLPKSSLESDLLIKGILRVHRT